LSTHLRLHLPSGLFPSRFPTNILYAFLLALAPIRATCPAQPVAIPTKLSRYVQCLNRNGAKIIILFPWWMAAMKLGLTRQDDATL
jgi:hypothetical protein